MLENDGLLEPTSEGAVPADDIEARLVEIDGGLDDLVERVDSLDDLGD